MDFRPTHVGLEGMGMVFGVGRRDARETEEPQQRQRVPYRLASYEHDHEGKRFKSSNVVYSFWSASKYVLILSLMLWWLPMFGQMIAGFVGGRRAGSPWKGVAASIVPVVGLYCVMTGFESGFLPSHVFGVAIAPAAISAALSSGIPFISPYIQFSSEYVGSFVQALAGSSPYGINTYVLTVVFAYVGGVLAEQNRREIEYSSGAVMNTTTVLVHDGNRGAQVAEPEKHHGVISAMGSVFHLPGRHADYANASAGFAHIRHRDPWSRAAQMHYGGQPEDDYALPPARAAYDDYEPMRTTSHRHRRVKDPWKQKRRGATNMSAKPRFNYPQYESAGYKGGMIRRSKDVPRYTVAPDARSIRRAEKMIDREWEGRRHQQRFVEEPDDDGGEETEAVAVHRREHHHTHDQWDSI